jgi:hypothetical protein
MLQMERKRSVHTAGLPCTNMYPETSCLITLSLSFIFHEISIIIMTTFSIRGLQRNGGEEGIEREKDKEREGDIYI